MNYIKLIVSTLVVALAIIFMIQNIEALSHPLAIRLNLFLVHFKTTPYATYLIILLAFFVGLLAASVLGVLERLRMRRHIKAQQKQINQLNRELSSLRNLPVTGATLEKPQGEEPPPSEEMP